MLGVIQIPKFTIKKACSNCGQVYLAIPDTARPQPSFDEQRVEGWFWDCHCKGTVFLKLDSFMTKVFKHNGEDFSAFRLAEEHVKSLGMVMGSMEGPNPIGVHKEADYISKWTRMTLEEQESLDGKLEGDFRNGDVTLTLREPYGPHE
jgi:hypothetical protein